MVRCHHGTESKMRVFKTYFFADYSVKSQNKYIRILKFCSISLYKHDSVCFTIACLLVKPLKRSPTLRRVAVTTFTVNSQKTHAIVSRNTII